MLSRQTAQRRQTPAVLLGIRLLYVGYHLTRISALL
jgi:hypothetical protein